MLRNNFLCKSFCILSLLVASSVMSARDMLFEGKGAFVHSTNDTFHRIYGNTGLIGAEFTFQAQDQLYPWVSLDFLYKKGHSIGLCTPTRVALTSLGIGLKYFIPICYGDAYFGAGLLVSDAYLRDCSPFVVCKNNKVGVGGIAKIGAIFDVTEHFFIDLFANYSYTKINFHNNRKKVVINCPAKFSNLFFGVGLGYRFDGGGCCQ